MAIKYNIQKFPTGAVAKALAQNGGAHIYSVTVTEDTPNGVFIGKGDFVELDHYKAKVAGAVTGSVVAKASNGNYYVEIEACDEGTLFVSSVALIDETWTNEFKKEENFYNPKGSEVRAYQLRPGDIIELNKAALGYTEDPKKYPEAVEAKAYGTSTVAKQLAVKGA